MLPIVPLLYSSLQYFSNPPPSFRLKQCIPLGCFDNGSSFSHHGHFLYSPCEQPCSPSILQSQLVHILLTQSQLLSNPFSSAPIKQMWRHSEGGLNEFRENDSKNCGYRKVLSSSLLFIMVCMIHTFNWTTSFIKWPKRAALSSKGWIRMQI